MGDLKKTWLILAFGLIFIAGSALTNVLAQEFSGDVNGNENDKETNGSTEDPTAEKQGYTEMFGKFEVEESMLCGRYVSFDQNDSRLNNYTFVPEGQMIFRSIDYSIDIITEDTTRMDSAVYHAEMDGLHVTSHNNPTAMLHMVHNGDITVNVSFVPAEGVTFGDESDGVVQVLGLPFEAEISIGTLNFSLEEDELNITLSKGENTCFLREPYQSMSSFQEIVMRSIQEGKVDGELQIMNKEGESFESQHFPYEGKVQMQTKDSEDKKVIRVQVQSQEKNGKVLMFRIQGELLDKVDAESVRINFDGEKAVRSGDVDQVLSGNTSQCKYYVEKDDEGCYQAMVYVPEFSTHEISFEVSDGEEGIEDSPFITLSVVLLIFTSAVLVVEISKRRRDRQ